MSGAAAPPAFVAGMVLDLNPATKGKGVVTLDRTTDGDLCFELSTRRRKGVARVVVMMFEPADWPNLQVISSPVVTVPLADMLALKERQEKTGTRLA